MIKLKSKTKTATVIYGRIIIETRLGDIEFSYQTGVDYDANYEVEKNEEAYRNLTEDEQDEIDDIISQELNK